MNIVITGASSGVGYEAALQLIENSGNKVVALARSGEKLQELSQAALIRNPDGVLFPIEFDIIHGEYDDKLIPFVKKNIGRIDVLINNAGALINKPFFELDQLDFVSMLQSNFLGHIKVIQNLLPLMLAKGGHIVNIGSMGGFPGSIKFPGLAAYSTSKAALHSLTECLALELEKSNIKVNCLALGSAQTEMLEKAFPGYVSPIKASEMGKLIADFAVTGHQFFNGKILPVSVTTP
ncbi:SDR family oxidoreductase [Segetibacter sp.]|jgi:NAD(P)-dependent dehydrogenase (short-subunit alcohol dehydrogenase family)|uniref:SDR family NAD(P)-dependent oxidoreductase n=1 Tax=Segetibacter sp. TaxID=2231182 RepID=UPI00260D516B|nr:SDR family oxidoreductase [Segetibacter sp.]MCW3080358.1 short-chain dehydrogenase [Segetibacter sp.]